MRRGFLLVTVFVGIASADPSVKPPHGAKHIALDYTYQSFHHSENHYTIEWNKDGYRAGTLVVPSAAIEALYASLTALRESDRALRCISHTDDYPQFTVRIDGDEPIQVSADSNCHGYLPWNVTMNGKQFVQFSGDAGRAVMGLFAAVDPSHWKGPPDGPEAFTEMGREFVELSRYKAGETSNGPAATCARDLETTASRCASWSGSPASRCTCGTAEPGGWSRGTTTG